MTIAPAFAFFDVDDTLLAVKSMFDFYRHYCLAELNDRARLDAFEADFARLRAAGTPREELNRHYYRHFKGLSEATLGELAGRWWRTLTARRPNLFFAETVERLRAHQRAGVAPVFVSGSCAALLRPVAEALAVTDLLAAPLLLDEAGAYTGDLGEPQTIGDGKRAAVEAFLAARGSCAADSHAYGDDISDAAMLAAVGHPVAVGAGTALAELAAELGWPVLPLSAPAPLRAPLQD